MFQQLKLFSLSSKLYHLFLLECQLIFLFPQFERLCKGVLKIKLVLVCLSYTIFLVTPYYQFCTGNLVVTICIPQKGNIVPIWQKSINLEMFQTDFSIIYIYIYIFIYIYIYIYIYSRFLFFFFLHLNLYYKVFIKVFPPKLWFQLNGNIEFNEMSFIICNCEIIPIISTFFKTGGTKFCKTVTTMMMITNWGFNWLKMPSKMMQRFA